MQTLQKSRVIAEHISVKKLVKYLRGPHMVMIYLWLVFLVLYSRSTLCTGDCDYFVQLIEILLCN